jgi:hypothetical protein
MSKGSTKQQIVSLLHQTVMSPTDRIVFLFRIFHENFDTKILNDLCKKHLIPALVKHAKYSFQFIALVRTKFNEFPLPEYGVDDLESMMILLRGSHRQAARFFLTALNNKATDMDICSALSKWRQYMHRDREVDPDGRFMSLEERATAIHRLLEFRDDIEPVSIFLIVWHIIIGLRQMPALLDSICNEYMFMPLVEDLAITPGGLRHVREKILGKGSVTPMHRADEGQPENPDREWQPQQPTQPGEDQNHQRQTHRTAYARPQSYLMNMPTPQETNTDELSRTYIATHETKHQLNDLDELLVQMKSLA